MDIQFEVENVPVRTLALPEFLECYLHGQHLKLFDSSFAEHMFDESPDVISEVADFLAGALDL